jgi:hypothetical protein
MDHIFFKALSYIKMSILLNWESQQQGISYLERERGLGGGERETEKER